jgi:DNA-binding Lrp family transcriptional regulator
MEITETQKRILLLTQEGIPFTSSPFHDIAEQLGLTERRRLFDRSLLMQQQGIIRRFGVSIATGTSESLLMPLCVKCSEMKR